MDDESAYEFLEQLACLLYFFFALFLTFLVFILRRPFDIEVGDLLKVFNIDDVLYLLVFEGDSPAEIWASLILGLESLYSFSSVLSSLFLKNTV